VKLELEAHGEAVFQDPGGQLLEVDGVPDRRDEEGAEHTIYTLTAEQKNAYELRRKWLVQECRAGCERWPVYYRLIEAFASVRPGWATTIHKSQGSTYASAYVVETNVLDTASDPVTRDQLLYVAYSRAQHKLVLS